MTSLAEASRQSSASGISTHKDSLERLSPVCWPENSSNMQIDGSKPIFTIGSCFARNIELRLKYMGVPLTRFAFPMTPAEWPGSLHDIINKFTPASIYNEIKWSHDIYTRGTGFQASDTDEIFYDLGDGTVIDGQLAGFIPMEKARAVERRHALYDYFSKIFEAESVIFTLGLIECWWDDERKRYIEQVPHNRHMLKTYRDRFYFTRLTYDDAKALIEKSIELVNSVNGRKKILITTSPVPLAKTFTEDDVIVANMFSKSLLRTVAGELAAEHEDVEYFSSYETVNLTRDWFVFDPDKRHVSQKIVSQIIARAIQKYFFNISEVGMDFVKSVALLEEGKPKEAVDLAQSVVERDPAQADYLAHLGRCLQMTGRTKEAQEVLRRAYDLEPEDPTLLSQLTRGYMLTNQLESAIETLEHHIKHHGRTATALQSLAYCYLKTGRSKDALEIAEALIADNNIDDIAHTIASHVYEEQGDVENALKHAKQAARVKWENVEYQKRVTHLEAELAK